MTISQIRWTPWGSRDIHLLPGHASPRLDQLLQVYNGTWHRADQPPDDDHFTLTFRAGFTGAPSSRGVKVNGQTGEVTVDDPPSSAQPWLGTFLVTASVSQPGSDPDGGEMLMRIRVFVHQALVDVWLTPPQLTVRQDSSNMRFSVLASFDDGSIGDISNWSPLVTPEAGDVRFVRSKGTETPILRWSPQRGDPSTGIYADLVTGEIGCEDPTATAKISVQRDLGNPLASAHAIGAPPWSTPTPLTRVAGGGFPTMYNHGVRNVLILPDGFADADQDAFNAYVADLVHNLNTNAQTRPYDLFRDRFNYFTAWVPSPQPGISILGEVYADDPTSSPIRGVKMELPYPPPATPTPLTLRRMLGTVGPPSPKFDHVGDVLGGTAHPSDWLQLYGDLPTQANTTASYPDWLDRTTRVLVNEVDTAFHVSEDFRPRVDRAGNETTHIAFHPLRLTTDDFDVFLQALRDDQGNPLVGPDGQPRDVPWAEGERDSDLVVILCRSARDAGTNSTRGSGRYLCVTLFDDPYTFYQANPDQLGFDLVPDGIPATVAIGPWSTVAHELAHSITIGDEYGGLGNLPESLFNDVRSNPNVQERDQLTDDDDHLGTANLKWRWPRLRQAGELQFPSDDVAAVRPDPDTAGQFLLSLAFGHGYAFEHPMVDIVQLRGEGLTSDPTTSGRLKVIAVNLDEITVVPLDGVDLDPADFTDGDLVIAPMRETDPNAANDQFGADVLLVHPRVLGQIGATQNPLNADLGAPPNRPCPGTVNVPTPATNLDHDIMDSQPRLSYQVVGLYENGHEYDCGVYHPTGLCIMAATTVKVNPDEDIVIDNDPDHGRRISGFCPVCRYAMVDAVDPSKHGRIDVDYDKDYPK